MKNSKNFYFSHLAFETSSQDDIKHIFALIVISSPLGIVSVGVTRSRFKTIVAGLGSVGALLGWSVGTLGMTGPGLLSLKLSRRLQFAFSLGLPGSLIQNTEFFILLFVRLVFT